MLPATAGAESGFRTHVLKCSGSIKDEFVFGRRLIGRGGFGEVSVGVRKGTRGLRAVKSVPQKGSAAHHRDLGGDMHEAHIMEAIDHPNVVKLIMIFEDKTHMHLVLELCCGGDLAGHLKEAQFFCPSSASSIIMQVLQSVAYAHNCDICHRDVKLDNFLVHRLGPLPNNTLKMADFGLACRATSQDKFSVRVGTARYMAPEIPKGHYDRLCDVWSSGVIYFTLICGFMPFVGKTDEEVIAKIKRGNYMFSGPQWEDAPSACKQMVRGLLKYEPAERWTAEMALQEARKTRSSVDHRDAVQGPGSVPPRGLAAGTSEKWADCGSLLAGGIWSLAHASPLRRAMLRALAWQSDEISEEIEDAPDLCGLFLDLDANGDGWITAEDLRSARIPEIAEIDVEGVLERVCPLDYTGYLSAMYGDTLCLKREFFRDAFSALDRDCDGVISCHDLAGVPGCWHPDFPSCTWEEFHQQVCIIRL